MIIFEINKGFNYVYLILFVNVCFVYCYSKICYRNIWRQPNSVKTFVILNVFSVVIYFIEILAYYQGAVLVALVINIVIIT